MKYTTNLKVDAIYDENGTNNPFLEALPELMIKDELFSKIASAPPLPEELKNGFERRNLGLYQLPALFVPMDYMYDMYDFIYRTIQSTYMTENSYESIRQINYNIFENITAVKKMQFCSQAECGAVLGVPGIGKTSSLRHCLGTMPQVIVHQKYHGEMLYCHQITHLFVECPSDCSIKTLGHNIAYAIDKALGTNYASTIWQFKRASVGMVALTIKQLCATYHIGVIIIDEIQNLITTNAAMRQNPKLIKFLVELMNDTSTSIVLVGTLESDELFSREDHLKRRTRGLRLLPMEYDNVYKKFLQNIWQYQYTEEPTMLTENFAKLIYTASAGITSYIIKIFIEAQSKAILAGARGINEDIIRETITTLSIIKTKTYTAGVSISRFTTPETGVIDFDSLQNVVSTQRFRRGRRPKARSAYDLLQLLMDIHDIDECEKILLENHLLEVFHDLSFS